VEELNLYSSKRKKVKFTTFLIYVFIMLLPSIAAYYMLDVYWEKEVDSYNVIYKKALSIIDYKFRGTKQDIDVLNRSSEAFSLKATVLKTRQKETLDFIKKSYISKKMLKEIFNLWETKRNEWMVLKELSWTGNSLDVDMYRIYDPSTAENLEKMEYFLRKVGTLKSNVIFNVNFIDKIKLERVVFSLNVSGNR